MRSFQRTLLPALLLASAGCGDLLFFEVEQPEICKTLRDQTFAGAQTSFTFDVDLSHELQGLGLESPEGVEPFIRLTGARFIARSGITNFDFIDEAHFTLLAPEASGLPPFRVVEYTRTGPSGTEVELQTVGEMNLTDYIFEDTLRIDTSLSGRLPPEDWSMDIEVCVYGRARINYLELAGL